MGFGDGSCAKHLTIEFYTVIMPLMLILIIIISIPSNPHSFIPGLKPSFSENPSHRSLPYLLQDWLHGFPGLFTDTEHTRFLLLIFLFFHFLVVGSLR